MTATTTSRSAAATIAELARRIDAEVRGDGSRTVTGLAPLDTASGEQLAFLSNPLYLEQAARSTAAAVIVSPRDLEKLGAHEGRTWLVVANPYAAFARLAQWFAAHLQPLSQPGIAHTASIAVDAEVPASCTIGPGVIIEPGAVLGERVVLQGNVVIGRGARIGADTRLYANVNVYHDCVLGERCIVHSGAVIGADGFGFAPDFGPQGGEWVKIPQTGRVVVGDDVEIGANTTIDRGAMADTVIEQGCKIDNQVQIAHNVVIGAYTVIAGCAAVAGSSRIGRYCVIGGSANVAGHLTIADRITISGGTSITRSIKASGGHYTSVFPFMAHADWEKNAALLRGLVKLRERIKQLETLVKPNRQC